VLFLTCAYTGLIFISTAISFYVFGFISVYILPYVCTVPEAVWALQEC